MTTTVLPPETLKLKTELEQLLTTLKHNRDKVPLEILRTKYKTGYEKLCKTISNTAVSYLKQILFYGIRIHKDYIKEGISVIETAIQESGLIKKLSKAAFSHQNISEFTNLAFALRKAVLEALLDFCKLHTGLLSTPECIENPSLPLVPYCFVTGCILVNGKWIPFEDCSTEMFQQLEKIYI